MEAYNIGQCTRDTDNKERLFQFTNNGSSIILVSQQDSSTSPATERRRSKSYTTVDTPNTTTTSTPSQFSRSTTTASRTDGEFTSHSATDSVSAENDIGKKRRSVDLELERTPTTNESKTTTARAVLHNHQLLSFDPKGEHQDATDPDQSQ